MHTKRIKIDSEYGLPIINQEQFSFEFEDFFNNIIFPFLEDLINEAKTNNILFV